MINDKANIDYLINTGERHKLVQIEIDGNHYFTTQAIRERMFLQTADLSAVPARPVTAKTCCAATEESIANLYQSNGFRDVKVTHADRGQLSTARPATSPSSSTIEEGPQYFVEQPEDRRHRAPRQATQILARLSSVAGQPFSEFNVAVDRDTILAQYFEMAFPTRPSSGVPRPAAEPHRIDLRFVDPRGPAAVRARGADHRQPHHHGPQLINRNITLNPGDPLSPTAMTDMQRRLYDLGVFARVDTAIQNPDGETDRKYVLYNMEEARRYSMAVGFGAELGRIGGCQTCFDAPAGHAPASRRASRSISARNNLWGLTHSSSLRTRVSTLDQRGAAELFLAALPDAR